MSRFGLGLRSRITVAFALGGLFVAFLLAAITLTTTRQVLLADREEIAQELAFSNASNVQRQLGGDLEPGAVQGVVDSLSTATGSRPLLIIDNGNFSRDASAFSLDDVPAELQTLTFEGNAGRIRAVVQDSPAIVYGVPIRGFEDSGFSNVVYFESLPLTDVEDTIETLQLVLLGGILIVAALAALAGRFAATRALAPLRDVSGAAEAIAGGRLDTRLDPAGDEDLESLVASFNEMAGGLEERIERDARFASEVSHELRSPLMTLTASVEVLENTRDDLPDRARTALDLLSSDITRFRTLVEDLLEISRFDVGNVELQATHALRRLCSQRCPVLHHGGRAYRSASQRRRSGRPRREKASRSGGCKPDRQRSQVRRRRDPSRGVRDTAFRANGRRGCGTRCALRRTVRDLRSL